MPYKITRPDGSQRRFAYGFELKPGESIYVDNLKVAAAFNSLSWIAKEIDAVEKGSLLINSMENETLKALIDDKDRHFAIKPKGKWLLEKPDGWTRIFVSGFDTRKPFGVEDYDVVEKFAALKFKVTNIETTTTIVVSPVFEDPVQKEKDGATEELKAAMEGADRPKGAPLTTYSMAKRKPGRPRKEQTIGP